MSEHVIDLDLVRDGRLELEGRLLQASNGTFYCGLSLDGVSAAAVYKPVRGERPLWDFPEGSLAKREVATYRLSVATGWDLVPPTVLRDGPLGPGMCQLWIETAPDVDAVDIVPRGQVPPGWRRVFDAYDGDGDEVSLVHADTTALRRMALLDVIANNADRKGGHLLSTSDGQLHGVDHGLCFHVDDKLRTVLWGFAKQPLTDDELEVLDRLERDLAGPLCAELSELLEADEIAALRVRIGVLRKAGVFPEPGDGWPAIPWPVF